ncbi:hypothetical protein [Corynebacterium suedekumii]|uniref:Secreted protein n=1 Tax=Corynebacterium suedekumii TaxID=3049801 RepID=A0ABY8VNI4_9CORY|nr:hypothetical protein [Corynebacterium suedekumii]WIM71083.1 hypothetical protein QP029_04560 [Corynebacterium suedekumii]
MARIRRRILTAATTAVATVALAGAVITAPASAQTIPSEVGTSVQNHLSSEGMNPLREVLLRILGVVFVLSWSSSG